MKHLICGVALVLLSTSPTFAGQGFLCSGPDAVEVHLPLSGGHGLYPLSISIEAAGHLWTSDPSVADATTVTPAQSFSVDDRYYFDFTNPNYEGVLASIRLFRAAGADEPVFAGILSIVDVGAWAITCEAG
jgi:hypothetical protein